MTTNDANKQIAVAVRAVYEGVLAAWNRRAAEEMAAPVAESCLLIGYDGSIMRSVQVLVPGVVLLPAAAGLIPAGQSLQTCHCLQSTQSACAPT